MSQPPAAPERTRRPIAHVVFYEPCIPGNSGAAIRLAALTGAVLHLVEPLGFDMSEAKLRRAGLDYHDLAHVELHPDLDDALAACGVGVADGADGVAGGADAESAVGGRAGTGGGTGTGTGASTPSVWAFTANTDVTLADADLALGDVLLFGPEPTGLPDHVLEDPRVTARVRIPMRPGLRSLNLANAATVALYELWRRADYVGGA